MVELKVDRTDLKIICEDCDKKFQTDKGPDHWRGRARIHTKKSGHRTHVSYKVNFEYEPNTGSEK